jgi:hypothetical protein
LAWLAAILVALWRRGFTFSNSYIASLTKHLHYKAIAQAYITNIISSSRRSSNLTRFWGMSQPLARSAGLFARSSTRATPSAFLHQCRKSATQKLRIEPCMSLSQTSAQSSQTSRSHHTTVSRPIPSTSGAPHAHARPLSNTSRSYATVVTQNPRVDDDGKHMTIEISPRAAKVGLSSLNFHAWCIALKSLQQFDMPSLEIACIYLLS